MTEFERESAIDIHGTLPLSSMVSVEARFWFAKGLLRKLVGRVLSLANIAVDFLSPGAFPNAISVTLVQA